MSAADNQPATDLITAYLARMRASLRVAPGRAAEIVAEAEDHLREATAARVAAGLGEPEAQRAAIEAFGPAAKMARAHRLSAREALVALAIATWPLIALYLLVAAVVGGAIQYELPLVAPESAPAGVGRSGLHPQTLAAHLQGMPTDVVGVLAPLVGCALVGAALLTGYLIARRRLTSRVPAVPLRALFPFAAATVLAAIALAAVWSALTGTLFRYLSVTPGLYELEAGVFIAAGLMAVGCALWGMARLTLMTFTWLRSRDDDATPVAS